MRQRFTLVAGLSVVLIACATPPESPPTQAQQETRDHLEQPPDTVTRQTHSTDDADQPAQAFDAPQQHTSPPSQGAATPDENVALSSAYDEEQPEQSESAQSEDDAADSTNSDSNDSGDSGRDAGQTGKAAQSQSTQPEAALTDEEEISRIEQKLNRQLGDFDAMLLGRQEQVKASANEQGGDTDDYHGDEAMQADADTESIDSTGTTGQISGGANDAESRAVTIGQTPNRPGDNRAGEFEYQASPEDTPKDLPDSRDDDAVARQLREAAMRETDPVLKEKLWDEYRKYKKGS